MVDACGYHLTRSFNPNQGEQLSSYIDEGGYAALSALSSGQITADGVLKALEESGLRGRGGAGYPASAKWGAVRESLSLEARESDGSPTAYVIANGDEGDPGAFMNRALMEQNPHAVIEGMAIAGLCLNAPEGVLFTRMEYSYAVESFVFALEEAKQAGLLSKDGECFFDIKVVRSGGGYLCGESTALVNALQNKVGIPRTKPPHLSETGLWGKPTLVSNVETLANVPYIIRNGADWFRGMGTEASPGTKLFCVTGAKGQSGVIESELGTKLHDVIAAFSQDAPSTSYRAVQIGGPSGSILPIDVNPTLDYDSLSSIGGIMGSGGIVLLDHTDCIVETVRYYIAFSQGQSCGRCRSCKDGLEECSAILDRLTEGRALPEDIGRLEELAIKIPENSKCGLGKAATRCLASSLRHFGDDFADHLKGRCRAHKCKPLIRFEVVEDKCPGCRCCLTTCPSNAMQGKLGRPFKIDQNLCEKCWMCMTACPYYAVEVVDSNH